MLNPEVAICVGRLLNVVQTVLAFVLNGKMIMLANGDASVTNAPTCYASGNSTTPSCLNNSNCSTTEIAELQTWLTNSGMTESENNVLTDEWREAVDTMKVSAILQISMMIVFTALSFIPQEKEGAAQCAKCLASVLAIVALVFMCMYTKDVRDLTDVCAGFEPYEDSLKYMRMMWALVVVSYVIAILFTCVVGKDVILQMQSAQARP